MSVCSEEPCKTRLREFVQSCDDYQDWKQAFQNALAALGIAGGVSALAILKFGAKSALKAVPGLGWLLLALDAAAIITLIVAARGKTRAWEAMKARRSAMRQACPSECWHNCSA